MHRKFVRGVAQLASALAWGARGRKFESSHPDNFKTYTNPFTRLTKPDIQSIVRFFYLVAFNLKVKNLATADYPHPKQNMIRDEAALHGAQIQREWVKTAEWYTLSA